MKKHRLAVIVGSNSKQSINRKLAIALVKIGVNLFEADFIRIDDLPMYNFDLEPSRPDVIHRFTDQINAADAVLIVMPEHNRSLPAVLKNAIDWGSKPMENNVWRDKPVAITGTSPGVIGTAVGQQHLRQILGVLGSIVLGGEAYIGFTPELFAADGTISIESTNQFLRTYLTRFASLVGKIRHDA